MARFNWPKTDIYQQIKDIATQKRDFFVITSNADGMFEQNGFPIEKIYTSQGDYSNLQCLKPCTNELFPILPYIEAALPFIDKENSHEILKSELVPKCKNCGGPVMMNVRGGDWFLEQTHKLQRKRYLQWVDSAISEAKNANKFVVILEIGVGFNTPSVIRWPVEALARGNGDFVKLVRINLDRPELPEDIAGKNAVSIAMDASLAVKMLHDGNSA